ncbi:MAG: hypothetical protein QG591_2174 [Planctomycetota bacterium]|nr:hypothetical protein [Planctomycetota bacterium]
MRMLKYTIGYLYVNDNYAIVCCSFVFLKIISNALLVCWKRRNMRWLGTPYAPLFRWKEKVSYVGGASVPVCHCDINQGRLACLGGIRGWFDRANTVISYNGRQP